jgi:hypothetical protein
MINNSTKEDYMGEPGLGRVRAPNYKLGISLTLDPDLLEWLRASAKAETVSVSYLVNRFCMLAKEALQDKVEFPDRKIIKENVRRRGLKDAN